MAGGRPTDYTDELAVTICGRLAQGESLRKICKDDGMPDKATVMRWLAHPDRAEFRDQYARARELQADFYADEILEIADDASRDMKPADGDAGDAGVMIVDHEHIARSRLRVDARKWHASKLAPKKYGDRVAHEHAGPGGGAIPVAFKQSPQEVADELAGAFGAAAAIADGGAPPRAAEDPPGNDPVVHPQPDSGGGEVAGTSAPGEAEALPERPVLPADGDLPPA